MADAPDPFASLYNTAPVPSATPDAGDPFASLYHAAGDSRPAAAVDTAPAATTTFVPFAPKPSTLDRVESWLGLSGGDKTSDQSLGDLVTGAAAPATPAMPAPQPTGTRIPSLWERIQPFMEKTYPVSDLTDAAKQIIPGIATGGGEVLNALGSAEQYVHEHPILYGPGAPIAMLAQKLAPDMMNNATDASVEALKSYLPQDVEAQKNLAGEPTSLLGDVVKGGSEMVGPLAATLATPELSVGKLGAALPWLEKVPGVAKYLDAVISQAPRFAVQTDITQAANPNATAGDDAKALAINAATFGLPAAAGTSRLARAATGAVAMPAINTMAGLAQGQSPTAAGTILSAIMGGVVGGASRGAIGEGAKPVDTTAAEDVLRKANFTQAQIDALKRDGSLADIVQAVTPAPAPTLQGAPPDAPLPVNATRALPAPEPQEPAALALPPPPRQLPPPTIEVDAAGNATTNAQALDAARAADTAAQERARLGLTPDVERAQQARQEGVKAAEAEALQRGEPGEVRAPEPQPAPAPVDPALEQRYFDDIDKEIGWDQVGGSLIRGNASQAVGGDAVAGGGPVGRTTWIGMPRVDGEGESGFWRNRPANARLTPDKARAALAKARAGEPLKPIEQRFVDYARQTAHEYAQEHADEMARHQQALQEQNDIERQQDIENLRSEAAQFTGADANDALSVSEWARRALDSGMTADDVAQVAGRGTTGEKVARLAQAIKQRGGEDGIDGRAIQLDRESNGEPAREGQDDQLQPPRASAAESGARGDLFPAASHAEQLRAASAAKDAERNGLNRPQQPFTHTDLGATPHGNAPEQARITERGTNDRVATGKDVTGKQGSRAAGNDLSHEAAESPYRDALAQRRATARKLRETESSLVDYGEREQREWLGGAAPPKDGRITIYRAVRRGEVMQPGDYVTTSRAYAEQHLRDNMGGDGEIVEQPARMDEIFPADGPKEFFYAPRDLNDTTAPGRAGASKPAPVHEVSERDLSPQDQELVQRTRQRAETTRDNRTAEATLEQESRERGEREAGELGLRGAVVEALGPERAAKLHFVHDEDGLPEDVRGRGTPIKRGNVRYGLHTLEGDSYIFTKHANTPERAAWTAIHEVGGHGGVQELVNAHPDVKVGARSVKEAYESARNLFLQNPTVAKLADVIGEQRGSKDAPRMAEEAMAELQAAQRTGRWDEITRKYGVDVPKSVRQGVQGAIANFVRRLKAILNAIHAKITGKSGEAFTDADVHDMLNSMWEASKGEHRGAGEQADQQVFHGTPYRGIEKEGFKLNMIGAGEGAQAYGYGIYFAGRRDIAEGYRNRLGREAQVFTKGGKTLSDPADIAQAYYKIGSIHGGFGGRDKVLDFDHGENGRWGVKVVHVGADGEPSAYERPRWHSTMPDARDLGNYLGAEGYTATRGQLYHAEIPEDDVLLDWDKPLSEQPSKVLAALKRVDGGPIFNDSMQPFENPTGESIYRALRHDELVKIAGAESGYVVNPDRYRGEAERAASEALNAAGIPGLRYLDGGSRAAGKGSHNYVIWDEAHLNNDVTPYYSEEPHDRADDMGRGAGGSAPDEVTGVKNAQTAKERAARGLDELNAEGKRSYGRVWTAAESTLRDDPQAGVRLAAEIAKKPRALTPEEQMVLAQDRARIFVERHNAAEDVNAAVKAGDAKAEAVARDRLFQANQQLETSDIAARQSGYEQGLALSVRRMMAELDYSREGMETRLQAAKGKPLDVDELNRVRDLHQKMQDVEAKLAGRQEAQRSKQKESKAQLQEQLRLFSDQWKQGDKPANGKRDQARQTQLAKQILDLKRRIEEGDYSKVIRTPIQYNEDTRKLEAERNRLRGTFEEMAAKAERVNRGPVKKTLSMIHDLQMASILASLHVYKKLAYAVGGGHAMSLLADATRSGARHIPGIKGIAEQAPQYGLGLELRALRARAQGIKEAPSEVLNQLRYGMAAREAAHGMGRGFSDEYFTFAGTLADAVKTPGLLNKASETTRALAGYVGRSHAAEKEFLAQPEFREGIWRQTQYMTRQMEKAGRSKDEIAEEMGKESTQAAIGAKALERAFESKMQGKNDFSRSIDAMIGTLDRSPNAGANFLGFMLKTIFPIRKVGVNIVVQGTSLMGGGVKALAAALKKGDMTPERADYIMKNIGQQGAGAVLLALGAIYYDQFGGVPGVFSKKDQPKHRDATGNIIKPGEADGFGTEAFHGAPAAMIQVGASMAQVFQKEHGKRNGLDMALNVAGRPTLAWLTRTIPYTDTVRRMVNTAEYGRGRKDGTLGAVGEIGGQTARGILVPGFVQQAAAARDSYKGFRRPRNFAEDLKLGVPGLREQVPKQRPR